MSNLFCGSLLPGSTEKRKMDFFRRHPLSYSTVISDPPTEPQALRWAPNSWCENQLFCGAEHPFHKKNPHGSQPDSGGKHFHSSTQSRWLTALFLLFPLLMTISNWSISLWRWFEKWKGPCKSMTHKSSGFARRYHDCNPRRYSKERPNPSRDFSFGYEQPSIGLDEEIPQYTY